MDWKIYKLKPANDRNTCTRGKTMPDYDRQPLLEHSLQVLIGLPMSIARNAADMKVFHFGEIQPHPSGTGTVGLYALHIQCPWRLVSRDTVYTGTSDRLIGPADGKEVDNGDPRSGSLQDVKLASLLGGYDEKTRSFLNTSEQLIVTSVNVDSFGGADLLLSGDYRLQIFPDGSCEEDWRLVEMKGRHLVIEGGRLRIDD
ncbi:hypothetical protein C8J36_107214 [Rhizobium sp. PP-F2F-G48]|uniref:hypothetical protein n=1 Tax=Rhizobium sp. PP-F2F-G48 TaxID=2135651 RepID=UPI0010EFE004|nr:hypothetical protein [Rhizobium sp. PP-F2F-G48]TCM53251.1 hypothetical protein C8J36_107214 [Rhizobium sp. PP-F2F-G48]